MITWKDFVLDDRFGALLSTGSITVVSREGAGGASVMDDGAGTQIQETGQVRRPARMAGESSLEVIAADPKEGGAASAPLCIFEGSRA